MGREWTQPYSAHQWCPHMHLGAENMTIRVLLLVRSSRGQTVCEGPGVRFPQMALSSPIPHIILPPCSVVTTHEQKTLQDVVLSPYITSDDGFKVKRRSDCFWLTKAHYRHTTAAARVPASFASFEGVIDCFISKIYAMSVSLEVLQGDAEFSCQIVADFRSAAELLWLHQCRRQRPRPPFTCAEMIDSLFPSGAHGLGVIWNTALLLEKHDSRVVVEN